MLCPSCGLAVDQPTLDRCPRCGRMLTPALAPASDAPQVSQSSQMPSDTTPDTTSAAPPLPQTPQTPPSYVPYPLYPLYPPPAPYSGPPPGSYYGHPVPPSQPYGQAAASSYPLASGYPPSTYAPSGYPQGQLAPLPERKKNRTGLVIGVVALVVVVLAACTGGTIWAMRSQGQTAITAPSASTPALGGTPTPGTTATATATVIYQNTFASDDTGWLEDPDHCFLKKDGYHITNNYSCYAPIGVQTDIDVSVKAQQVRGPTTWPYGIMFRLDNVGNDYQFNIDSNSQWEFARCARGTCTNVVDYTRNAVIRGGLNTPNTLEVHAEGSHFDFFVNGTKVGSYDDSTYSSGEIGLVAIKNVEAVFTDLVVTRPD